MIAREIEQVEVYRETWGSSDQINDSLNSSTNRTGNILMTTEPCDLIFDPACGSDATASLADQSRQRWYSYDTNPHCHLYRRQRLLTANFNRN
jgi:adenine-specific DNA-methyltransferase